MNNDKTREMLKLTFQKLNIPIDEGDPSFTEKHMEQVKLLGMMNELFYIHTMMTSLQPEEIIEACRAYIDSFELSLKEKMK